jgi:two-component system, NarL family, nitrate/nitrite sensor histidine kinase NarX
MVVHPMENKIRTIRWITFLALLTTAAAYLFPLIEMNPTIVIVGIILVLIAAAMLTWALETWLRFLISQTVGNNNSKESPSRLKEDPEVVVAVETSRDLISAKSIQEVVDIIIRVGISLFEATGASFISFDEWGISLPPITRGNVPLIDRQQWTSRLTSSATRQACRNCVSREAELDCVLFRDVDSTLKKIICQPIRDNVREIGIISFFFDSPKAITISHRRFLNDLADSASLALVSIRQRDKEIATLKHLQSSPAKQELPDLLTDLLLSLEQALEVKSALIWIPEGLQIGLPPPTLILPHKQSRLNNWFIPDEAFFQGIWQTTLVSRQIFSLEHVATEQNNMRVVFLVIPLVWKSERPVGLLLLIGDEPLQLNSLQMIMLQTIAGETSMLILNSRLLVQMEYQAVVDERTRLAREIHDGLAQTLAFLKIQSAQMQNYLHTGKLVKLDEILSANAQTLAGAYQDARQAIDNLRSVPGTNTQNWLLHLAKDFTDATGISVDVSQLKLDLDFPPTIQAQLLRIVQEAFSNIRKHAHAKNVIVIGIVHGNEVVIEIRDDGVGFEPEQIELASRYGLVGMRERTDMIGGDFQIISKQGAGTIVRLSLPSGVRAR